MQSHLNKAIAEKNPCLDYTQTVQGELQQPEYIFRYDNQTLQIQFNWYS